MPFSPYFPETLPLGASRGTSDRVQRGGGRSLTFPLTLIRGGISRIQPETFLVHSQLPPLSGPSGVFLTGPFRMPFSLPSSRSECCLYATRRVILLCKYFKLLYKNNKNRAALAFHDETQCINGNRAQAESIYNLLLQTAAPLVSLRETRSGRQPRCASYRDGPGLVVSLLNGSRTFNGKERINNASLAWQLVLRVHL